MTETESSARPPRAEYADRRAARQSLADHRSRWEARIVNARTLAIGAAAALVVAVWRIPGFSMWWTLLPASAFVVLVVAHDRVRASIRRARRAVAFYDHGLARLEDRWHGIAENGARFLGREHLYAGDLDILGPGSLFELLCIARTRAGEETLARWLLAPASAEEVRARQDAVEELRCALDLREDLAMLGDELREGVDPEAVSAWAAARVLRTDRLARIAPALLAVANLITLAYWFLQDGSIVPFAIAAAASLAYSRWLGSSTGVVIESTDALRDDMDVLTGVLRHIESARFESSALTGLQAGLRGRDEPASHRLRALRRLIDLLQARQSVIFAPVAAVLLWGTQLATLVEVWRRRNGLEMSTWLDAVGAFEALSCLAAYAYEHPDDPFPVLVDGAPRFEALGAAHPLIPAGRAVRNDVRLADDSKVWIVSGSNMSGKSTLLRTVGVNAVLAQAGAPVRCRSLRMSPLAIGASIAVRDSLQDDTSHFYAELLRLRGILGLTNGPVPVLFLVDEILHGTNSHDRLIGSTSLIHTLLERGAVGLATTHDLGLCAVADDVPVVANVHFQDDLRDGHMVFDYLLRTGPVGRSNALALMRSLGLLDDGADVQVG